MDISLYRKIVTQYNDLAKGRETVGGAMRSAKAVTPRNPTPKTDTAAARPVIIN